MAGLKKGKGMEMKAEVYISEVGYVRSRPHIFVVLKEEDKFRIEYYGSLPQCPEEVVIEQLGKPDRVFKHFSSKSDGNLLRRWLEKCIPGKLNDVESEEAFQRFCVHQAIERDMIDLGRVRVRVSDLVSV